MATSFEKSDSIYSNVLNELVDFKFDRQTVDVFVDMINRSVPGYGSLIRLLSTFGCYVKPNTKVYDLGCSLGSASLSLLQGVDHQQVKMIAVDNSQQMIDEFQTILNKNHISNLFDCRFEDVCKTKIDNASVVIMNLTLQFIKQNERDELVRKIYQGLNNGGVFVLTEKVVNENQLAEKLLQTQHEQFKFENGYSKLEISQKRQALENVLVRDTLAIHIHRLQQAGFTQVVPWFQAFQFVGLMAVK
jgi:tRNA (cmo5U34)-methyltransferase